ncbi:hypothetical protein NPX99_01185 [Bartonella sp. 220]|uniref:type IV secretion system protein n=1 Tax=Bartonella sp. 220B TaxID=2967260 RepID=UPI0022A9706A|nr:type IV secretion system protein [Bartonella sp. 220B]MCZ2157906.1 hypothetical protein [Bartonella sp. 220B]
MKKLVIATAISASLITSNPTLRAEEITKKVAEKAVEESEEAFRTQLLEAMENQVNISNKQLFRIQQIHDSITGVRIQSTMKKDEGDLLLEAPQHIYNENKEAEISSKFPKFIKDIQAREEEYSQKNTVHETRELIDLRTQYAAILDKVVSLQVFEEADSRFMQIAQYLMEVRDTQDLKSIAELQVHIKSTFAMIQNEATKLQMVAHLRNAEQALIRQQKYKRNIQILNHKNTQMPTVKIR